MIPIKERLLAVFREKYLKPDAQIPKEWVEIVELIMALELHKAPESLFWYWISERHSIYLKRQAGRPKPWTLDPILTDYKFTNPFRENDRGTVWLRENFLIPHKDSCSPLIAFNICWYRMFNWWGTGELLGWQTGWNVESIKEKLELELRNGRQVFTGAHIVYSPPGLGKIEAIVKVCEDLFNLRETITETIQKYNTLETTFEVLKTINCVGGFMAYEMVSDMRHTKLLENATDIMTWANPGPGAKRGLQRLGMPYKRDEDAIKSMQDLLENWTEKLWAVIPEPFTAHDYPLLEMRDIEHSLCEFDKYCRVKFGEGQPRGRYNGRA